MSHNIQITTAKVLAKTNKHIETPDKTYNNTVNGKYHPYGITGYIVNECSIVCSDCIENLERNPKNAISTDSEWDFPGAICEECNKTLDTHLLVYESQDPKLHYKLKMSEFYGEYDKVLSIEDIAKRASEKAKELGKEYMGDFIPNEINSIDEVHMPTDSAHYANNILPSLRKYAGYNDSMDVGTYTDVPLDEAYHVYQYDVFEAFQEGYYQKARELLNE
jgi:hypothetical protein